MISRGGMAQGLSQAADMGAERGSNRCLDSPLPRVSVSVCVWVRGQRYLSQSRLVRAIRCRYTNFGDLEIGLD